MSALKLCPWCGTSPLYSMSNANQRRTVLHVVACQDRDCPVKPRISGGSVDEVMERWNRRAQPPARVEVSEELLQRAADHLVSMAHGIRHVAVSEIELFPYLPDVDDVAEELSAAIKGALGVRKEGE